MTLTKWMRRADIDERVKPGQCRAGAAEIRELRKRNRLLEQENEAVRLAAAYLSQANLSVACRMLKLSSQPYYRWLQNPITPSEVVEAYRANASFDAHTDDPEFGHRLLADEAREVGGRCEIGRRGRLRRPMAGSECSGSLGAQGPEARAGRS